MKKIELSDHFSYGMILLYSLPAIGETLGITSFQMVDGYFVSTFLGVTPFAAVNFVSPIFFVLYGIGFMFGSGTSAIVAQHMGEKNMVLANQVFSMSMAALTLIGIVIGALATLFMPELSVLAGATESTLPYCSIYGRLLTIFLPVQLINGAFLTLWVTAEKAWLGMAVSVANGGLNVLMDWFFMGPLGMGIAGAAWATSLATVITSVFTFVYFFRPNSSSLRFIRFGTGQMRELIQICTNGFSEMTDSISANLTQLVMNHQLIQLIGEIGVAAMGVYSYVVEFFMAVFFGIASTSITVVGYKYGEKNKKELESLLRKTTVLTFGLGVMMYLSFALLARPIAGFYIGYDDAAFELTARVLRISSMGCLTAGFVVFSSSFFTGLEDGRTSAIIAGCNSLVLPVGMAFLLPAMFGAEAIWYAFPVASFITAILCVFFLRTQYPRLMASI